MNPEDDENETQSRTLVLDNLIHGYFILDHPERLDYDYEHIYALVAYRAAKASGKITLADENAPATRRRPDGQAVADLPEQVFSSQDRGKAVSKPDAGSPGPGQGKAKEDEKTKKVVPGKPAQKAAEEDLHTPALPRVEKSTLATLFLGGGAYSFQRHIQYAYPGTAVDVAEIDPAVTNANFQATGLPRDTPIKTYWGDARQFVDRHQNNKQYDLIFGDAFNDFSVPWHLTTREFNDKIAKMMSPKGVYMINIIDAYESDQTALAKAEKTISTKKITEAAQQQRVRRRRDDASPPLWRVPRFVGQNGKAHVPLCLHFRYGPPCRRRPARDVRGGCLAATAGPERSGPPRRRPPVLP